MEPVLYADTWHVSWIIGFVEILRISMLQKSSKHYLISIFFPPVPSPARHFVPRITAVALFMTIHAPPSTGSWIRQWLDYCMFIFSNPIIMIIGASNQQRCPTYMPLSLSRPSLRHAYVAIALYNNRMPTQPWSGVITYSSISHYIWICIVPVVTRYYTCVENQKTRTDYMYSSLAGTVLRHNLIILLLPDETAWSPLYNLKSIVSRDSRMLTVTSLLGPSNWSSPIQIGWLLRSIARGPIRRGKSWGLAW